MRRYLFSRDTLFATILVFILIGLLALIPLNTHVFDPIRLALHDFDYNDMAYSKWDKNGDSRFDDRIVIVNVGDAGRAEIAGIIAKVQEQRPTVTGVDILFEQKRTPADDSLLVKLAVQPGIVMAYKMEFDHGHARPSGFLFEKANSRGFANFVGEDSGVIRHIKPFVRSGGQFYNSFAGEIVAKADPLLYKNFPARGEKVVTINYTRQADKYLVIDGRAMLTGQDSFPLTGKIVLIGFIPAKLTDVEDKHFTPMNPISFGKSDPDMYGVLIHANIISMILDRNYVTTMPAWLTWAIAFVICWLHMAVFLAYAIEKHLWFHLVAKIAQVVSAVLFVYLGLLFFYRFDYKLNLTPTFIAIILAVDVLYFYEAICNWLYRKYRLISVFHKHKHH